MNLLLLVVIVLFVVIMEHIKTWSTTLILLKLKNGKIIQLKQNLNCTNFGIYAACCNISKWVQLKTVFVWVKLKTVFPYVGIHPDIFRITAHWILKRQHYLYITLPQEVL